MSKTKWAAGLTSAMLALEMLWPVSGVVAETKDSTTGFYFDTVVTFTLYNADMNLIDDLHHTCAKYENMLSKTVTGSDVWRINNAHGETVTVSDETWEILYRAKEISAKTGGAFSITIAPLTAMWDFTGGTNRMPTDEERIAALPLVDDSLIELGENNTVTLPEGMQIDLGGIAKGFIADQVAAICRERTTAAVLNFGGNVYTTGQKENGKPFVVGISDPDNRYGLPIAVVSIGDATVVTSGTYERYFEVDGVRYHHILDPETGMPSDQDLVSATIIGSSSMDSDAYATACIVLGSEEAMAMLENYGLDGMLIDYDGNWYTTEGFTETYSLTPYGT